jgi:[acyl-carrier-protein] S-malonyltransferase
MTASASAQKRRHIALMFPGQGSQFPGMAADLAAESPRARALMSRADEILGYPLSQIMTGDRADELNRTVHTQPAIFVHSMALLEVLRDCFDLEPTVAAGHSLGEYSALCAAGVLSFETALDIIRVRAVGMDQAQPLGTCCMAALVGLPREEVLRLVELHRGKQVLEAANFNAPDQVVISGHVDAVTRAVEAARKERRTRAVMLPVSSAFHTSLMQPAKEALQERLNDVSAGSSCFPVIANVNAEEYPASDHGIRQLLTEQVVRPVLWEDCIRVMRESGAEIFVEIGPGKVLGGLLRRIDRDATAINVSDLAGVNSFRVVSG